jgi:hypothetical protein
MTPSCPVRRFGRLLAFPFQCRATQHQNNLELLVASVNVALTGHSCNIYFFGCRRTLAELFNTDAPDEEFSIKHEMAVIPQL